MSVRDVVTNVFREWLNGPVKQYRLADDLLYGNVAMDRAWHHSLNSYLKTEADIQTKFGGYLEQRLLRSEHDLTVHAELNVYPQNRRWWADLSIHDVSSGRLWIEDDPDPIIDTVRGVIEIKYANAKAPDWSFGKGYIKDDIKKLSTLPEDVYRFFLLLDETVGIAQENIESTKELAQEHQIIILSNNQALTSYF
jgi:hypothetical protein